LLFAAAFFSGYKWTLLAAMSLLLAAASGYFIRLIYVSLRSAGQQGKESPVTSSF